MAAGKVQVSPGSVGLTTLLTVLFVALKLTNVISWSWLWVLAPMWIPLALAVLVLVVVFGAAVSRRF